MNKFISEDQFKNEKIFSESLLNHIDSHRVIKGVIALSGSLIDKAKETVDEYVE